MISHSRSIAICAKPQLQRAALNLSAYQHLSRIYSKKNSLLLVPKKMTAQKKWSFYNHFFCSFPTSKKNKGKRPEPRLLYISNCVEVGVPSTAIRKLQLFSKYCRSGYCIVRLMFKARTMTVVIIWKMTSGSGVLQKPPKVHIGSWERKCFNATNLFLPFHLCCYSAIQLPFIYLFPPLLFHPSM